jgi:hypothetical protein
MKRGLGLEGAKLRDKGGPRLHVVRSGRSPLDIPAR